MTNLNRFLGEDELSLFEHKGVKAYVREGTSDSFVVKEVLGGEYNKLNIKSDDIIVDFGMNIGMFTIFALKKGALAVWSYEAERENFDIALQNIELNEVKGAFPYNYAVVGNDDKTRDFSINTKKNKGAHSLVAKRGRDTVTVDCININTVLKEAKPDIVKMDIEGGEYECLKAIETFKGIREFILEFHHAHLNDIKTHEKYNEILDLMRKNFDNVEARKDTKGAWVNIIYCYNNES